MTQSVVETTNRRCEIDSSWTRSSLAGIDVDGVPSLDRGDGADETFLARVASPVLDLACREFCDAPVSFVLCDHEARVLDVRVGQRAMLAALGAVGIESGVTLSEQNVGTNAAGTVVESRAPLLIRGGDHYMSVFHGFSCYGHPILHPITRRLEGVVNVGGADGDDDRYFAPIARRLATDIEDRLLSASPTAQRFLLRAFQSASRRRAAAVLAIGEGLVMSTPEALGLLDPVDHAAIQADIEQGGCRGARTRRLELVSGRDVMLRYTSVEGTGGVLVHIEPVDQAPRARQKPSLAADFPLIVLGEQGTGRSAESVRALGIGNPRVIDSIKVLSRGVGTWLTDVQAALADPSGATILEHVDLLEDAVAMVVAECVENAAAPVAMTCTAAPHPSLNALCNDRRSLVPLRRRRHEIPRLAEEMLRERCHGRELRLTTQTANVLAAQPWPGNLAELRRVIERVAKARTVGDVIPADLPPSYRQTTDRSSPLDDAEREMIRSAIEVANGNKVRAARALGMSRSTLYNRMRALKIN